MRLRTTQRHTNDIQQGPQGKKKYHELRPSMTKKDGRIITDRRHVIKKRESTSFNRILLFELFTNLLYLYFFSLIS
ncbi:hypothetical protein EYC84_003482 [Monilinia fructicola]|uniref:Uncharacterized protein n=1 Tax=Monilinia fructicola TaxID=38448 RepID=A0A5M9JUP1_MONFR|nr:hypothetical protein EYC84_003482 [Monilinia fructicola]